MLQITLRAWLVPVSPWRMLDAAIPRGRRQSSTAVDFSEPARAAFDHALAISRTHNAELTVVHAVPGDRAFRWYARERIALIAALRHAAEVAGVHLEVSVQSGDPADVILLHARGSRADLIVLGTHQRTGLDRFRPGPVAETVSSRATQPVLIVPAPPAGRSVESLTPFNRILVGVDFSAGSNAAVERALSMANANSRVTLVHVIPAVTLASVSRYTYHLSAPQYMRLLARDARRKLQETISANGTPLRNVHVRVVAGDRSTQIARIASDVDADVILVGVTQRGIRRRLFGSMAARLIRSTGRLVLAIPELGEQRTVPVSKEDQLTIAA